MTEQNMKKMYDNFIALSSIETDGIRKKALIKKAEDILNITRYAHFKEVTKSKVKK